MLGCSTVGCSNRGNRGYCVKSFSRNPERRALSAMQMKRDDWQPNDNCRLCEVHFDDDLREKRRQDGLASSNPTLCLPRFNTREETPEKEISQRLITTPKTLKKMMTAVHKQRFSCEIHNEKAKKG